MFFDSVASFHLLLGELTVWTLLGLLFVWHFRAFRAIVLGRSTPKNSPKFYKGSYKIIEICTYGVQQVENRLPERINTKSEISCPEKGSAGGN